MVLYEEHFVAWVVDNFNDTLFVFGMSEGARVMLERCSQILSGTRPDTWLRRSKSYECILNSLAVLARMELLLLIQNLASLKVLIGKIAMVPNLLNNVQNYCWFGFGGWGVFGARI